MAPTGGPTSLEVRDTTPVIGSPRDDAIDLGDITDLARPQVSEGDARRCRGRGEVVPVRADGGEEGRFSGCGSSRANADLVVTDADGNELRAARAEGTANEWMSVTLLAGTYYVRLEAQEAGSGTYMFRYGVSAPNADEVGAAGAGGFDDDHIGR